MQQRDHSPCVGTLSWNSSESRCQRRKLALWRGPWQHRLHHRLLCPWWGCSFLNSSLWAGLAQQTRTKWGRHWSSQAFLLAPAVTTSVKEKRNILIPVVFTYTTVHFLYYINGSNDGRKGYCRWCVTCNSSLLWESICLYMSHDKRLKVGCGKSSDTSRAWQHCHLFECRPTVSRIENLLFTIIMFSFWDLSVTKVEGSTQLHIASAVKLKGIYLV